MNDFLKISKSKIILFLIIFFLIIVYLPTIKCFKEHTVKHDFCDIYGLCEVERYYSLWSATIHHNKLMDMCDAFNYPLSYIVFIDLIAVASAYLMSCLIDLLYKRYREK